MENESIGNQDSLLVLQYKPDFVETCLKQIRLPKERIYLASSNHELIDTFTKSLINPFGIFNRARFRTILIDFSSDFEKALSEVEEIRSAFDVLPPAAGVFLQRDFSSTAALQLGFLSHKFCAPVNADEIGKWIENNANLACNEHVDQANQNKNLIATESVPVLNNQIFNRLQTLAKKQDYPIAELLNSYSAEMGTYIKNLAMNVSIGKKEEAYWIILSIKSMSRVIGAEQIGAIAAALEAKLHLIEWSQVLAHIPELHFALKILNDEIASRLQDKEL